MVVIGITESFYFECSHKRLISTHTFDAPTDTRLAGTYIERIKLNTSIKKRISAQFNQFIRIQMMMRCDYKIYISIIKLRVFDKKKPDSILFHMLTVCFLNIDRFFYPNLFKCEIPRENTQHKKKPEQPKGFTSRVIVIQMCAQISFILRANFKKHLKSFLSRFVIVCVCWAITCVAKK